LFPVPGLTLAERISGRFYASGDWVRKVFRALPDEEITLLRDYVAPTKPSYCSPRLCPLLAQAVFRRRFGD
jgi:hypothetical protein